MDPASRATATVPVPESGTEISGALYAFPPISSRPSENSGVVGVNHTPTVSLAPAGTLSDDRPAWKAAFPNPVTIACTVSAALPGLLIVTSAPGEVPIACAPKSRLGGLTVISGSGIVNSRSETSDGAMSHASLTRMRACDVASNGTTHS